MLKTAGFEQTPTMRYVIATIIVISLIMIALYGVFIEPYQVKLKTVKIQNKALASTLKDLKIVLLSDLHIGNIWPDTVKETLEIIKELKPDLILLTGDYVEWCGKKRAYDNAIDFLSHLSAPLGVYAVMGDADSSFSRKSCEFCHEKGSGFSTTRHQVKFLRNSQVFVENRGKKFSIIGTEIDYKHVSNINEINKMLTDVPAILLSHTSIVYDNIDMDRNILVLSGDTHGGQIYLPDFIWRILKRKADPKHMYGLYQEKNKSLYITSGIGTSDFPIRLGVPPEVVLFEFKE